MKQILNIVILFCIIIFIPYFIICFMNGFEFDNNKWNDSSWLLYIIEVIVLGFLIAATIENKNIKL